MDPFTRVCIVLALVGTAVPAGAYELRLGAARKIAASGAYAPRFSPDGQWLLVTGERLRGLSLVPLSGTQPARQLTDDAGAGTVARFLPDGSIRFRALRAGVTRELAVDRAGVITAAIREPAAFAFERDDRIFVRDPDGTMRTVGTGDRFFGLVVSPDGRRLAFMGLASGIFVYDRARGTLTRVGAGTAPAWSPDGQRLIFERTEDDGHSIVASDLYLFDVASGNVQRLTATDDVLERRPSFSPDGAWIAFDDDRGNVLVGRLEVGR